MFNFRIKSIVRGLFRRSRIERDMHDELHGHIERYADDLVGRGLTREEAFRRARAEFGGLDAAKDNCRDVIGLSFIDEFRRNVGFALRMLRKAPSFSVIAILSLALGIGLNTTAFSLVNSILFRPLPVANPEKLVFLVTTNPPWLTVPSMSYPNYKDLRDQNDVLFGFDRVPAGAGRSPSANRQAAFD